MRIRTLRCWLPLHTCRREGTEVLPGWEQFKQTQLPEMNQQIKNAHHPVINPERKPTNMPQSGDQD